MRAPPPVLNSIGYDEMGNCERLLAPGDRALLEEGQFTRADGDAFCPRCHFPYRQHPEVQGALWLRRACWGLVKL